MAIFLSILKITGIVLLSIIGIIFLLLAALLFLPIHYKAKARFDKDEKIFTANAKVTFLAYLVHAEANADNNKFSYFLKMFGHEFFSGGNDTDEEDEERVSYNENAGSIENKGIGDGDRVVEQESGAVTAKGAGGNILDEIERPPEREKEAFEPAAVSENTYKDTEYTVKKEKHGHFIRVRRFVEKVKAFYHKCVDTVKNIGYTIQGVYDKIKAAFKKVQYYKELFELEASKEAIAFAWKWLKYLLWHIRPRRLQGYLKLGREDPADTGELLGLACALIPVYGRHFVMEPDFDREVLEGDFYMKGYIQLYVVARVLCKYYFNKNLRRFIKRLKRGREL